jgi:solute carrier family 25 carnitine/acylcarnitine transporter 20/29
VAGFAQVVSGQPFDIVKVRLQANPEKFSSAIDCLRKIIKEEGVTALYKGSVFPLLLTGTASSIQFGVNQKMRNAIGK